jgi:hypothetical protein
MFINIQLQRVRETWYTLVNIKLMIESKDDNACIIPNIENSFIAIQFNFKLDFSSAENIR